LTIINKWIYNKSKVGMFIYCGEGRRLRDRLLTPDAAGKMLGLTGQSIRNYLRNNEIPGTKLGGRWYIPESELYRRLKLQQKYIQKYGQGA